MNYFLSKFDILCILAVLAHIGNDRPKEKVKRAAGVAALVVSVDL